MLSTNGTEKTEEDESARDETVVGTESGWLTMNSHSRGSSQSPMVEVNVERMWPNSVHGNAGKEEWSAYR